MTRSAPSAPSTGTAWGCVVDVVRCEHHDVALGIGEARPRLSWKIDTADEDWTQLAYELQVASDAGVVESSGRIDSAESVLVPWPAAALGSRTRRRIRVRVWGSTDEHPTEWSAPAIVETGLLEAADWTAQLISPDRASDDTPDQPPTLFRRNFQARSDIDSARLYLTAHGVVQAEINGERVGQDVLTPGWTSYHHRLRYSTYDVTTLISAGRNALGATVADGWFRGLVGFDGGRRNVYGSELALLAQLEIRYLDGTTEIVATDDEWRAGTGPIRAAGIYDGESYDARDELAGWSEAGFVDDAWDGVRTREPDHQILVAPPGPPVRRIEEIAPVGIFTSPSGATIVDFGQNLVGRLRIRVDGPAGSDDHPAARRGARGRRTRHPAAAGREGHRPLHPAGRWRRGVGAAVHFPRLPLRRDQRLARALSAADVRAVVLHTDMRAHRLVLLLRRPDQRSCTRTSSGACAATSSTCRPTARSATSAWAGPATSRSSLPLHDSSTTAPAFLDSWLADLAAEQTALGTVPVYVPNIQLLVPGRAGGRLGRRGRRRAVGALPAFRRPGPAPPAVSEHEAWVDQVAELAGPGLLWDTGIQFGDWLDPAAPPDRPEPPVPIRSWSRPPTSPGRPSSSPGRPECSARGRSRRATPDSPPASAPPSPTSTSRRTAAWSATRPPPTRWRCSSGCSRRTQRQRAGTPAGRARARPADTGSAPGSSALRSSAMRCAASARTTPPTACSLQRDCPSWLYPVTMGATTIWERWDSMLPDGTINPGEMTSFNHYALGAVADWLHRVGGRPGAGRAGLPAAADRTPSRWRSDARRGSARDPVRSSRSQLAADRRPARGRGPGTAGNVGHDSASRAGIAGAPGGIGPVCVRLPVPTGRGRPADPDMEPAPRAGGR